jgi:hypothetical protein
MHSSTLVSAIVIPVAPHHATSPVPWALFELIAGNLAILITILILGIWGFRLGSKHQGGNGPGGGGPRKPHPQPPPPSGGRNVVSNRLPDLDLRDFSAWESELGSAATPKRQDNEKVPAGTRLGLLTFPLRGAWLGMTSIARVFSLCAGEPA